MQHNGNGRSTAASSAKIVSRTDDDTYRVYDANMQGAVATVTVQGDTLDCSCGGRVRAEPGMSRPCDHLRTILERLPEEHGASGQPASLKQRGCQLLLKRSVSPDGRIDALSVELSTDVDPRDRDLLVRQGEYLLGLQERLAQTFMAEQAGAKSEPQRNGAVRSHAPALPESRDLPGQPARALSVGAMDTRYGRRFFLQVEVDGKRCRFFGSRAKVAKALGDAGYPIEPEALYDGLEVGIDCRARTEKSKDGRYTNVVALYRRNGVR